MMKGPKNPERSFGVSVGIVLLLIATALAWRGRVGRAEIIAGIGAVLLVCGLTAPRMLAVPSRLWWRFSRALGHINARVLLTLMFSIILTPVSLVWRLTGKDPLQRRKDRWAGWTPHPVRYRDRNHYMRMY